ncbi:MAG: hypothetical protein PUB18_05285 [bacterium]|nr:hypothetical protein [bacterium]
MKEDIFKDIYKRQKNRKKEFLYTELLCEIIMLRYEFVYENINRKDVLNELPSLRDFTKTKIDEIYENAIKLLHIKYNVEIIQDNPFVFKDNRNI